MASINESVRSRYVVRESMAAELDGLVHALECQRLRLEELCIKLIESEAELEGRLRAWAKKGIDGRTVAESIAPFLLSLERGLARARERLADEHATPRAKAALAARIPETERFLAWLRELVAVSQKPMPVFDESRLPPLPEQLPQNVVFADMMRQSLQSGK